MLAELIDKYYQDKREDKKQNSFYISDAGKCQRAIYFSMKGYPKKEKEPRILRIFDRGDIIHQRTISTLLGIPEVRVIASEIDIPPKQLFRGRADAILSVDGKLYVVDVKSSSDFKFKKLKEPETSYQRQLQLYMHYFKIPQGILLYENKNDQSLKEFELKYDKNLCERIISEFQSLKRDYIDTDIVPPIPENLKQELQTGKVPWDCQYCDFREECNKIENDY